MSTSTLPYRTASAHATDRILATFDHYAEALFGGFGERTLPVVLSFLASAYTAFLAPLKQALVAWQADKAERMRFLAQREAMLAYTLPHMSSPMPTRLDYRDLLPSPALHAPAVLIASHDSVIESVQQDECTDAMLTNVFGLWESYVSQGESNAPSFTDDDMHPTATDHEGIPEWSGTPDSNDDSTLPLLGIPAVNATTVQPVLHAKRRKVGKSAGTRTKRKPKAVWQKMVAGYYRWLNNRSEYRVIRPDEQASKRCAYWVCYLGRVELCIQNSFREAKAACESHAKGSCRRGKQIA